MKKFKKRVLPIATLCLMVSIFQLFQFQSYADSEADSESTQKSVEKYLDDQIDEVNTDEIEKYLKGEEALKDVNINTFIKELASGKRSILDLFDGEGIKNMIFGELKASLRVVSVVLVLALLSSILKSLNNSFSSGNVSKVATYIVFITMVTFTLVGFKDVIAICYTSIDRSVKVMQIIIPIMISFLMIIGLPITSTTLNPIFIGGVTFINVVFKNFLFTSMTVAFGVLIINNLSQSIKLDKMFVFIKQLNKVVVGAMFAIYLGLVSMQGLYVTSFDKFAVKTAKFAVGNFIPVVGGFVSDSIDILLSSSQLIKNIFGGIGLVVLVAICLIPIIKIAIIILVYKGVAMAVEPIGEDNISTFLNEIANMMTIMLTAVIAVTIMFFVTVAILTSISAVGR
ncbi:MAG: stage III sporulation protein AE [Clostridioides sp.]|nr:stage III sporulation protein AE [Clostridioides sp.]